MKRRILRMAYGAGVAAALLASPAAWAGQNGQGQNDQGQNDQPGPRSVPEFDPAAAGAIAAFVAGGGLLLARRRKKG